MKKVITSLLIVLLLCSCIIVNAVESEYASLHTMTPLQAASLLNKLDLFMGTNNGFELDRPMTRAEAATMLVRLLGGEAEALTQRNPSPFTDTPQWAAPYLGWLYNNGLTVGTGNNLFSPNAIITYEHYALFLSRANAGQLDCEIATELYPPKAHDTTSLTDYVRTHHVTRGEAAVMSVKALSLRWHQATLAERLAEEGVFSEPAFYLAAQNLFEDYYIDMEFLPQRSLYVDDAVTSFFVRGYNLYFQGAKDSLRLLTGSEGVTYEAMYSDSAKAIIREVSPKGSRFFMFDCAGFVLKDTGITCENTSQPCFIDAETLMYLTCSGGVYALDWQNADYRRISPVVQANDAPNALCLGPDGVVLLSEDGMLFYVTSDGDTARLEFGETRQLLNRGMLLEYDGKSLTIAVETARHEEKGWVYAVYCVIQVDENAKVTVTNGFYYTYFEADLRHGSMASWPEDERDTLIDSAQLRVDTGWLDAE